MQNDFFGFGFLRIRNFLVITFTRMSLEPTAQTTIHSKSKLNNFFFISFGSKKNTIGFIEFGKSFIIRETFSPPFLKHNHYTENSILFIENF